MGTIKVSNFTLLVVLSVCRFFIFLKLKLFPNGRLFLPFFSYSLFIIINFKKARIVSFKIPCFKCGKHETAQSHFKSGFRFYITPSYAKLVFLK